ncbi:trimeric intracellular cation channel family protein [Nodosilinea sp. LEGE 06152]|uniref:trimeric intracellular cation channel family protein n=1 Tax=Nodosilinea sp. LEGE 06152 TaxID=2777966 RepID=UPI0018819A15|nr:trimeric intracellular cation channel family protein [Nodosilinea sp. LEGE 06152]MBE9158546.1 trimeric intracellular cation channel family protein [Nodosilinea sp. LEGE 06152]
MEYVLAQVGVVVFAMSGVLSAARQRLDIFSIVVVGLLTAVGGGTLRDVILDVPVFWLVDLTTFWVAIAASFITFIGIRFILKLPPRLLSYLDAMGVALFAVQAIDKTLVFGYPAAVAVVMGLITSIAGGIIRDVVTNRPTLLLSRELYATPIMLGSILYVVLLQEMASPLCRLMAMGVIFGMRAIAIRWQLFLPLRLTLKIDLSEDNP